jgi:hypothetical protein
MTQQRAEEVFASVLPFLREFHPYARYLANFCDHALLIYSRQGQNFHAEARQFPPINYSQAPPTPRAVVSPEQRNMTC